MPCVAIIEELKDEFELFYIGSNAGMEREIISKLSYVTYFPITTIKLIRSLTLKNLAIPFRLLKGIHEAKKILKTVEPDVIFSKGGYVALPVTMAARCPLVCHESDVSMGLANKLAKKKAVFVAASFLETVKNLKNGVHTGCPVRQSLYRPKRTTNGRPYDFAATVTSLNPKPQLFTPHSSLLTPTPRPVLLIMGGSLGATSINDCVFAALDEIVKKYDIIHITGKGKANLNKELSATAASGTNTQNHYTQIEFESDIGRLYAKASVVLSRGGGTALFELAALKIPSLVIPLPKGASRGDQIVNAEYFQKLGLCRVLPQNELSPARLLSELDAVLTDKTMKQNLQTAQNIDGTKKIAALIRNCIPKGQGCSLS